MIKFNLQSFINKIPRRYNNKFVWLTIVYVIWMLLFDSNSIINQVNRYIQINELDDQLVYMNNELSKANFEYNAIFNHPQYFEKFVREKYYLKRPNEDLFVFEEQ